METNKQTEDRIDNIETTIRLRLKRSWRVSISYVHDALVYLK